MNSEKRLTIRVYAHWQGISEPFFIGNLYAERVRGSEIFSFEYDKDWLSSGHAQELDPDLQLFKGIQYLGDRQKANFGIFMDSSPDRWGRVLLQRREAVLARKEQRPVRTLFETDYLLGLYDAHRMGALRFRIEPDGPFLDQADELTTPPWSSLRELESISLKLEEDNAMDDEEYLEWLNMLIAPGSSLGGARPKANIEDDQKDLWIAKFPSRADRMDSGAWEMVAYQLATACGIRMAEL
ncbi:MAG: HipA domain-containing protein [Bacteroidales bacterium]|nr:HipA domain-containing protein [Bacteroidales bacterium]